jgi:hypothetical protein
MQYRHESIHDVHVGFDLLTRYFTDVSPTGVTVVAEPGPDDIDAFRGPKALMQDGRLVADVLGVYLTTSGRHDALEAAKVELGRLD